MRKRRLIWVGIVLALGLVIGLATLLARGPGSATHQANFDRIAVGMTEGEVEAIFGRPADRTPTVQVSLEVPGSSVRAQKNWSGREHVAVVAFSPEGTVVWKSLVGLSDERWFDRLARRLGLPF